MYFIVVLTLLCPRSSCTVLMSYPSSSRCAANECRREWGVACFVRPAFRTAREIARWSSSGSSLQASCVQHHLRSAGRGPRSPPFGWGRSRCRGDFSGRYSNGSGGCGLSPDDVLTRCRGKPERFVWDASIEHKELARNRLPNIIQEAGRLAVGLHMGNAGLLQPDLQAPRGRASRLTMGRRRSLRRPLHHENSTLLRRSKA